MSTLRNRQTGADLCDEVSQALMRALSILEALDTKRAELLAPHEFKAAADAARRAAATWASYLDADLRATIAAGEHLEVLGEALRRGSTLILPSAKA